MATNITIRWAGPADASACSNYEITRTLNNVSTSTLAASQAATSPYTSPSSTLSASCAYGSASLALTAGAGFSSSGYGWLDDAQIKWLTASAGGVGDLTWYSGYGNYAAATPFYEAHESYADVGISPSNAVLYKITHYTAGSLVSAPAHYWYYYPPLPASQDHCVVVVSAMSDLGVEPLVGASARAYLVDSTQVTDMTGYDLLAQTSASRTLLTDNFGLAFFQCYKNSRRSGKGGGSDAAYTFTVTGCGVTATYTAASIPDRDWILLKDIADA